MRLVQLSTSPRADVCLPCGVVAEGVIVDGLVWSAVHAPVTLRVPNDNVEVDLRGIGHGALVDGAVCAGARVVDRAPMWMALMWTGVGRVMRAPRRPARR